MKKVLVVICTMLLFIPTILFAEGNNKVKVYIFEAGGCPYCEMEVEYLKGLSSYKTKFEIVKKELYVDHIDWKEGKDYKLGVNVATAFNEAGFEDAAYTGTPFVVISDIYAAASYSTDLEDIIEEAYEEGDKDAVACIASGKENCIRPINTDNIPSTTPGKINSKAGIAIAVLAVVGLVVAVIYIAKNRDTEVKEDTTFEPVIEKPARKTSPAKKTTTKTATKKTTKK